MKTIKKILSGILVGSMLCGMVMPAGATGMDNGENTTEQITGNTSEVTTEITTEITTETTTEITTEATTETTTEVTTEVTTETPTPAADVEATGLSPLTSKVVVIDPGHCKIHPGAMGNGLREHVVVMDIATACQEVLDGYGDVTVYMTRAANSCCASLDLGDCLSARNNYAKRLDADFLVSMHINAGRSNGANVLTAYKSGYNDSIRKETQKFGKIALKQLKAIGIANRGLLLRRSGTGNRYSNGKLADYYSIVRRGVVQEIPSVIIEHGYITSASDCSRFFRTKTKRKKVGKADAKAIVSYYGLSKKIVSGKISHEADGTYYRLSSGKKAGGFVKEDGVWYYFDEMNGKMCTGFRTIGDETIYASPSTGQIVVGWFTVDGNRYLAKGNGAIVKNCVYDDGVNRYVFNENGVLMTKGFYTMNDSTYYVDKNGCAASGIVKVKGKKYGFHPDTNEQLYGYQKIKGNYYYFDEETGVMQTGWQKIDGKYRYFHKSTGKMQKNKWIGKYYVNGKGIRSKKK